MPVVTFRTAQLCRVIGASIPEATLAERMPMLGGDLERVEGGKITIEWFPNRPDLLTLEGTGRAMRAFLGVKPGLTEYPVREARTELTVAPAVAALRPYAGLCFVRGVPFDDDYVATVMDAQEKLTHSPGRRRKKIAIGIHDAAGLQGPFTYTAIGPGEKPFVALGDQEAKSPERILKEHPKGIEYGHLVPDRFPALLDGQGNVLSLPPIVNAQRTAVTAQTRDVLVDVTGTDRQAVARMTALVATSLAERGGTIEAIRVRDASGTFTSPDLRPRERTLHIDDAKALLGLEWSAEEAAAALERMGHRAEPFGNQVLVHSPAWRFDLLHPVDLLEDLGIGHGFDRFPGTLPTAVTFGGALASQSLSDRVRQFFLGLGWSEAKTLTLSSDREQWESWGRRPEAAVRILNPVLEEQTLLRTRLAPSLLHVLSANRHRSLPQQLFEVGYVVGPGWKNRLHVAAVELSAKAQFSGVQAVAQALVRDLEIPVRLTPGSEPGLVTGRQGAFEGPGGVVGHYGEVHPDTLVAFGLAAPAIVLDLDLSSLL
ncbi:MAG: phenylalanine--tRNA ligase subunit beta [Thermoplasmatota archaeon]